MNRAPSISGNAGDVARLRSLIRDIPDYPKPGILFKDITPLLADADAFAVATRLMAEPFADAGVTHVVAIESRGFILGAPVAQQLGAGFVPVRKPGKLPHTKRREEYALEYGTDALEVHDDAVGSAGARPDRRRRARDGRHGRGDLPPGRVPRRDGRRSVVPVGAVVSLRGGAAWRPTGELDSHLLSGTPELLPSPARSG